MQTVYNFDSVTGVPAGVDNLRDDQTINSNHQTLAAPPENKSVKFDKSQQKWVEFTPPTDPVSDGPTAEQRMINALGLQVASLQATVTKLTTTNGGAA